MKMVVTATDDEVEREGEDEQAGDDIEHRARDLEQARAHAERLLTEQPGGRWREAAEHRLRRIERKLERQRPPAGLWPEV